MGGFPCLSKEHSLPPFHGKNLEQEDDLSGPYFIHRQENTQKEENTQVKYQTNSDLETGKRSWWEAVLPW